MYLDVDADVLHKISIENLIDIREDIKYIKGHIQNAKNITKNELMFNTEKYLDKSKKYYIYCNSGIKSKVLCKYLSSIGYNVVNVVGGYEKYMKK